MTLPLAAFAAFIVITGTLSIIGIVCASVQCVRHFITIWNHRKQYREE